MLWAIFTTYISSLMVTIFTTITLILLGYGWGPLPHKYLKLVLYVQELFPKVFLEKIRDEFAVIFGYWR